MFNYFYPMGDCFLAHHYLLSATGINMKDRIFPSRRSAQEAMYDYIGKNRLHIQEVYDDKHCKTYVCDGNIRFYINRDM